MKTSSMGIGVNFSDLPSRFGNIILQSGLDFIVRKECYVAWVCDC